ncbi:MAG: cache domain-containing protein [Halieaceae bacterium]|nr:cache domain-containing protein [Halieaceae bacterium]
MKTTLFAVLAATVAGSVYAADMGTPEEAKAMSLKAQAAVNAMGREKAFAAFADPDGEFRDRDLYVFCIDMEGVLLSQPIKPELVGRNMFNFNKYGDLLFQDMIAVAKNPGAGWVDYRWPYPGTDEIRRKTSYIAANDGGFFCGVGAYK